MKGIEQTSDEAYARKIIIITSTITLTEFEQARLTPEQRIKFQQLFIHPHWLLVDVDKRVASKAAVLRQHYDTRVFDTSGQVISGSFMSLGDSIHLATALQYSVAEFNTLDGFGKRTKRIDLLKLNGNVMGVALRIAAPKYVPPPEPLSGPVPQIDGQQQKLELVEEAQKQGEAAIAVLANSESKENQGEQLRGSNDTITEGQPQISSTAAPDGVNNAPPSPSPDSAIAKSEQSALGGEEQKLGEQALPPSGTNLSSVKTETPASDKPAGGSGGP